MAPAKTKIIHTMRNITVLGIPNGAICNGPRVATRNVGTGVGEAAFQQSSEDIERNGNQRGGLEVGRRVKSVGGASVTKAV